MVIGSEEGVLTGSVDGMITGSEEGVLVAAAEGVVVGSDSDEQAPRTPTDNAVNAILRMILMWRFPYCKLPSCRCLDF